MCSKAGFSLFTDSYQWVANLVWILIEDRKTRRLACSSKGFKSPFGKDMQDFQIISIPNPTRPTINTVYTSDFTFSLRTNKRRSYDSYKGPLLNVLRSLRSYFCLFPFKKICFPKRNEKEIQSVIYQMRELNTTVFTVQRSMSAKLAYFPRKFWDTQVTHTV